MSAGQQQRYGRRDAGDRRWPKTRRARPSPARSPRPPESVLNRYDRLHRWRKTPRPGARRRIGRHHEPGCSLVHRPSQPTNARRTDRARRLGPWRLATYWQEILRLLSDAKATRQPGHSITGGHINGDYFLRCCPHSYRLAAPARRQRLPHPARLRPLSGAARRRAKTATATCPSTPRSVDVLILSHAHIDHSGNIPNLVKSGFNGDIISHVGHARPVQHHAARQRQDSGIRTSSISTGSAGAMTSRRWSRSTRRPTPGQPEGAVHRHRL